MAQRLKRLPTMWETWVLSLGREDPLEILAAHSNILAWRIPWREEPGRLQSTGSQRVKTRLSYFTHSELCSRDSNLTGLDEGASFSTSFPDGSNGFFSLSPHLIFPTLGFPLPQFLHLFYTLCYVYFSKIKTFEWIKI